MERLANEKLELIFADFSGAYMNQNFSETQILCPDKRDKEWDDFECDVDLLRKAIEKLKRLEHIEEEYELPLRVFITLIIAALHREELEVYFKGDYDNWPYNISPEDTLNLDEKCIEGYDNYSDDGYDVSGQYYDEPLYFKDYGKTWALTKEELE